MLEADNTHYSKDASSTVEVTYRIDSLDNATTYRRKLEKILINIHDRFIDVRKGITTYENDISNKRKVFKLHFNINTGTTACLRKEV